MANTKEKDNTINKEIDDLRDIPEGAGMSEDKKKIVRIVGVVLLAIAAFAIGWFSHRPSKNTIDPDTNKDSETLLENIISMVLGINGPTANKIDHLGVSLDSLKYTDFEKDLKFTDSFKFKKEAISLTNVKKLRDDIIKKYIAEINKLIEDYFENGVRIGVDFIKGTAKVDDEGNPKTGTDADYGAADAGKYFYHLANDSEYTKNDDEKYNKEINVKMLHEKDSSKASFLLGLPIKLDMYKVEEEKGEGDTKKYKAVKKFDTGKVDAKINIVDWMTKEAIKGDIKFNSVFDKTYSVITDNDKKVFEVLAEKLSITEDKNRGSVLNKIATFNNSSNQTDAIKKKVEFDKDKKNNDYFDNYFKSSIELKKADIVVSYTGKLKDDSDSQTDKALTDDSKKFAANEKVTFTFKVTKDGNLLNNKTFIVKFENN